MLPCGRGADFPRRPCLAVASLLLAALAAAPVAAQSLPVYDDELRSGFENWSWAVNDLASAAFVHSGQVAIAWEPDAWGGLFLHRGGVLVAADYAALRFWVHGGGVGGQEVVAVLYLGGDDVSAPVPVAAHLAGGAVPAASWAEVEIPLAAFALGSATFDGIVLMDATGGDQPALHVDDISLDETPQGPLTVVVDPAADRRPIDPRVYGVNLASAEQLASVPYTLNRWGGNHTTRYNWQADTSNRGSDWFFMHVVEGQEVPPPQLPEQSAANAFIDATRAAGAEPVLTLGTIGWAPVATRAKLWGMSVADYGAQLLDECDLYPGPGCEQDAGNGECDPAVNQTGHCVGGLVVGNDPLDVSMPVGPSFATDWMAHVAGRVGTAGDGGVRLFALDNEPMLWSSTHRDVHPDPVTYDELWTRTLAHATAVKAQDPAAEVLGPVLWGWCAYFSSAADSLGVGDDCTDGPDRQAHGGVPLVPWYLQQVCAQAAATGTRPVDWLDVHYYPQGGITGFDPDEPGEDPVTSARRLRALRELWDPAWVPEPPSWIPTPVALVPLMRGWIDANCPGMKLAVTEYRWGADDGASGALAQAEALAIFGREGVDAAARWVAPAVGTKTEDAFRLFLDYDGAGSRVEGDSVRATSSDVDEVGAYAVADAGGRLFVLLFNKEVADRDLTVSVADALVGPVALYRFDAANDLGPAGSAQPAGGAFQLTLPARSATLAVGRLPAIFSDGFETGTAERWSVVQP